MERVESKMTPRLRASETGERNIRRHLNERVRHFRQLFRKISGNSVFE
jgi:hypothetical protein